MKTDKEKSKTEIIEITRQIQENEQLSEELKKEQWKWNNDFEDSSGQMKQQIDRVTSLYQELVHFGDKTAYYNQEEAQEIYRNVQSAFRSQKEIVESTYRISNQQLEDINERLCKERGAL